MGSGLVEVVLLGALTIIVLPGCLFTLLALLDRFERSLDPDALPEPTLVLRPAAVVSNEVVSNELDDEAAGADVVSLPVAVTMTEAPAAATG